MRAERDILARSNQEWIVNLKFSFQDDDYLYLVMEYLAGGDLMTLLIKKDVLSENEARFYIAECVIYFYWGFYFRLWQLRRYINSILFIGILNLIIYLLTNMDISNYLILDLVININ